MTENGEVVVRKRRSSEEVRRLVTEFESSGLGQNEFCRKEGLALSTLRRQLKRRQAGKCQSAAGRGLVRVELARRNRELKSPERCGLEVVLSNGRKIAVWPDFDLGTLERLVGVLEKV
jgi:transposase-like protein